MRAAVMAAFGMTGSASDGDSLWYVLQWPQSLAYGDLTV